MESERQIDIEGQKDIYSKRWKVKSRSNLVMEMKKVGTGEINQRIESL